MAIRSKCRNRKHNLKWQKVSNWSSQFGKSLKTISQYAIEACLKLYIHMNKNFLKYYCWFISFEQNSYIISYSLSCVLFLCFRGCVRVCVRLCVRQCNVPYYYYMFNANCKSCCSYTFYCNGSLVLSPSLQQL